MPQEEPKPEESASTEKLQEPKKPETTKKAEVTVSTETKADIEQVSSETREQLPKVETEKRELTPEEAEKTLSSLEARFKENTYLLHEGIEWSNVRASLEANPEALWSLAQMEAAGHEPDVYHDDKTDYYFGTCSKESPKSARNCVYDKKAADYLRKEYPNEKFNGSAVEMAEAMGITLMMPEHYRNILQEKGKFHRNTWSWLMTQSDIRSTGKALYGYRYYEDFVSVSQFLANNHLDYCAWRGSLKVKKVA